jgi:hypothetical protein
VRLAQVRLQVTIDRAARRCGAHRRRLGGQQLDATEATGSLGDEAYPQGGIVGG